MFEVTFLGNATFGVASEETSVLIDPYVSENEECPWDVDEVYERVGGGSIDALCVTHIGYDHIGDTLELALEHGTPVITEPATMYYLQQRGVPEEQITKLGWGLMAEVGDLTVRALEAHHLSSTVVDGNLVTGLPLGFLVTDGDTSVYHPGDTSIFSDLKLFGELYEPDVTLLGVGQAHSEADLDRPVTRIIHEFTTEEAVMVARWLGSDTVVPMHYLPDELDAFVEAMDEADDVPDVANLEPGESLQVG